MKAIWKGAIGFGLVNSPVALCPVTKREELRFHLLRASDLSRVNYKRIAEADGQEVPWDQIVKGYEYEKDKFVVLREEDFQRVDLEAAQTVEIANFVHLSEVNPTFFYRPYFIEPQKGGDKAYVLLREVLRASGKVAIATVVIQARKHLAAVKPQQEGLILELMHFAGELRDVSEFRLPEASELEAGELEMALALVESMSGPWQPEAFTDEYRHALQRVIEEKIWHEEPKAPKRRRRVTPTKVRDLTRTLKQSLDRVVGGPGPPPAQPPKPLPAPRPG